MATSVRAKEIGATGIHIFSHIHRNIEDYNLDLNGNNGMRIYDKMRSSDGEIAASLARIILPILSAEWRIDSVKADVASEQAKNDEIADFVGDVLIERPGYQVGQSDSFGDFIRQALLMLPFGFMAFEKVWGTDDQGRQVVVKLAPRLPKTFWEFVFKGPGGEFSGAVQRAWSPSTGAFETKEIPAEKLVLFVFGREGDNFWGRSILRSCYKHWDFKETILWVGAASIERYGMGVLELHATEDATGGEKSAAEEVAREFRSGESQFLYTPAKFLATFHHPPAGQSQAIEFANYNDQQISRSMMSEFMATGTAQTGSRAIVATKVDLLMLALKGTANIIEQVVNQQIIQELVTMNFGVQENYPELKCEDLDKMSGTQFAEIMKPLVDARLIVPDLPLREYVRSILDLPEIDEATQDAPIPVVSPFGQPVQPPGNGAKPAANQEQSPANPPAAKKAVKTAQLGSTPLYRDPLPHEKYAAFTEYQRFLDTEPVRLWTRIVKGYRDRVIVQLAQDASTHSDKGLAAASFAVKGEAPFTSELSKALMRVYLMGRQTVLDERARQLANRPVLKDATPQGEPSDPTIEPTPQQTKWVNILAGGFIVSMLASLKKEAARAGIAARNANATQQEQVAAVTSALHDLSEAVQEADLGGAVNRTFINGRDEQAASMQDQIAEEFYSCVLDANSCSACESLDGQGQQAGDESFTTPNPDCEGGDRCRCVTIYVWREAAA